MSDNQCVTVNRQTLKELLAKHRRDFARALHTIWNPQSYEEAMQAGDLAEKEADAEIDAMIVAMPQPEPNISNEPAYTLWLKTKNHGGYVLRFEPYWAIIEFPIGTELTRASDSGAAFYIANRMLDENNARSTSEIEYSPAQEIKNPTQCKNHRPHKPHEICKGVRWLAESSHESEKPHV
jgi:hypothetical protein